MKWLFAILLFSIPAEAQDFSYSVVADECWEVWTNDPDPDNAPEFIHFGWTCSQLMGQLMEAEPIRQTIILGDNNPVRLSIGYTYEI